MRSSTRTHAASACRERRASTERCCSRSYPNYKGGNAYAKDTQIINIHNARRYIGDRLIRTAAPHRILDPAHGPLIAVKLNILTRKTLGGFETDLDSRVFGQDGKIMPGLYAAGEAAGFGGGGMHGYRSLEGTFLGGCLFSGRNAGRAAAKAVL